MMRGLPSFLVLAAPFVMAEPVSANAPPAKLVILINGSSATATRDLNVPMRYALAAAAMDVIVEVHAVGPSVAWFRNGAADPDLLARVRTAVEFGVDIFVCPQAMAEQGVRWEDLIDEVEEVRGAASLLGAGLAAGAHFMCF